MQVMDRPFLPLLNAEALRRASVQTLQSLGNWALFLTIHWSSGSHQVFPEASRPSRSQSQRPKHHVLGQNDVWKVQAVLQRGNRCFESGRGERRARG